MIDERKFLIESLSLCQYYFKVQYCNLHGGMSETDDDDLIIGGWAGQTIITVL